MADWWCGGPNVLRVVLNSKVLEAWHDFVIHFVEFVQYHQKCTYGASTFAIGGHPALTPEGVPLSARQLREELARE